jgi:hypothetical protein
LAPAGDVLHFLEDVLLRGAPNVDVVAVAGRVVTGNGFPEVVGPVVACRHRDRTRASTLSCFCLFFFSSFEHAKNLLIMGPNNTKDSSKSVIFSYLTMNNIVRILL